MKTWLNILLVLLVIPVLAADDIGETELRKERDIVKARLAENPDQVILAVNGLCCRTCAVGIGNKVCKLDFVDVTTLPKGVKVDRKESLLTVSIKSGKNIDLSSLIEAIRKAGYDPVRFYRKIHDSVTVTKIAGR